jgi:hypothetical protein
VSEHHDAGKTPVLQETPDRFNIRAGNLEVSIDKQTGMLVAAKRGDRTYPLANGPRLVARPAVAPTTLPTTATASTAPVDELVKTSKLLTLDHRNDGPDCVIDVTYDGNLKSVQWRIRGNGWIQIDYTYSLRGPQEFFGVGFDLPESDVKGMKWLGNGPYRVWKNRVVGGTLNVWQNDYNNTITGHEGWKYPEFKGYYSDVRWAQLQTTAGPITAVIESPDLFLQVLAPAYPQGRDSRYVSPAFPSAGLSFLHAIPAIGTKFRPAWVSGPQSQPAVAGGDYSGSVSLFFGELQH